MNIFETKEYLEYLKKQVDYWERATDFREIAPMIPVYNDEESYYINIGIVDFSTLKKFVINQLKKKITAIDNVITAVKVKEIKINYEHD